MADDDVWRPDDSAEGGSEAYSNSFHESLDESVDDINSPPSEGKRKEVVPWPTTTTTASGGTPTSPRVHFAKSVSQQQEDDRKASNLGGSAVATEQLPLPRVTRSLSLVTPKDGPPSSSSGPSSSALPSQKKKYEDDDDNDGVDNDDDGYGSETFEELDEEVSSASASADSAKDFEAATHRAAAAATTTTGHSKSLKLAPPLPPATSRATSAPAVGRKHDDGDSVVDDDSSYGSASFAASVASSHAASESHSSSSSRKAPSSLVRNLKPSSLLAAAASAASPRVGTSMSGQYSEDFDDDPGDLSSSAVHHATSSASSSVSPSKRRHEKLNPSSSSSLLHPISSTSPAVKAKGKGAHHSHHHHRSPHSRRQQDQRGSGGSGRSSGSGRPVDLSVGDISEVGRAGDSIYSNSYNDDDYEEDDDDEQVGGGGGVGVSAASFNSEESDVLDRVKRRSGGGGDGSRSSSGGRGGCGAHTKTRGQGARGASPGAVGAGRSSGRCSNGHAGGGSSSSSSSTRVVVAKCPLTQRPLRDPVVCVVDGVTYERSAVEAWVKERGTAPSTGQPASQGDLHSTRRVVGECVREAALDVEAAKLARLLLGGGDEKRSKLKQQQQEGDGQVGEGGDGGGGSESGSDVNMALQPVVGACRELGNVPLHLRKLRKAAVGALHTFHHREALRKQQQQQQQQQQGQREKEQQAALRSKADGAADASAVESGAESAAGDGGDGGASTGGNAESVLVETHHPKNDKGGNEAGAFAGDDDGAAGAVVGLELASALNDLEVELLTAQRQRRRQQAEERLSLREKRRRAETRRKQHESLLGEAVGRAEAEAARAKRLEERVRGLEEETEGLHRQSTELKETLSEYRAELVEVQSSATASEAERLRLTQVLASTQAEALEEGAKAAVEATQLSSQVAALQRKVEASEERRVGEQQLAEEDRVRREQAWEARWEGLPEHQQAVLEGEREGLARREGQCREREAALLVREQRQQQDEVGARDALRLELDEEKRRQAKRLAEAEAAAKKALAAAEKRREDAETAAFAASAASDAKAQASADAHDEAEATREVLRKERQSLALESELFAPRQASLRAQAESLAEVKVANEKLVSEAAEARAQAASDLAGAGSERNAAQKLVEEARTLMQQVEREALRVKERESAAGHALLHAAEEKGRAARHEGDVRAQVAELKRCQVLLQRFERALMLQARVAAAATSKAVMHDHHHHHRQQQLHSSNHNSQLALSSSSMVLATPVQDAAFALALEGELGDILRQLEARMASNAAAPAAAREDESPPDPAGFSFGPTSDVSPNELGTPGTTTSSSFAGDREAVPDVEAGQQHFHNFLVTQYWPQHQEQRQQENWMDDGGDYFPPPNTLPVQEHHPLTASYSGGSTREETTPHPGRSILPPFSQSAFSQEATHGAFDSSANPPPSTASAPAPNVRAALAQLHRLESRAPSMHPGTEFIAGTGNEATASGEKHFQSSLERLRDPALWG